MPQLTRQQIAWRVAQDIPEGSYVNLGSGMPLMVSDYVPAGREIIFHSENGLLGIGPRQTGAAFQPPGFAFPFLLAPLGSHRNSCT